MVPVTPVMLISMSAEFETPAVASFTYRYVPAAAPAETVTIAALATVADEAVIATIPA
jgi:hypothetical protein